MSSITLTDLVFASAIGSGMVGGCYNLIGMSERDKMEDKLIERMDELETKLADRMEELRTCAPDSITYTIKDKQYRCFPTGQYEEENNRDR